MATTAQALNKVRTVESRRSAPDICNVGNRCVSSTLKHRQRDSRERPAPSLLHPEPLRLNPLRCLYGLYPFLSVQSKGPTHTMPLGVNCLGWEPEAPAEPGWFLLGIFDTDDGPYVQWARRVVTP